MVAVGDFNLGGEHDGWLIPSDVGNHQRPRGWQNLAPTIIIIHDRWLIPSDVRNHQGPRGWQKLAPNIVTIHVHG